MRGLFALAIVACYSPQPVPGSPCDVSHPCPDPLVCSIAGFCTKPGGVTGDAPIQLDAPADTGSLIDAPPAPSNDLPPGATVITGTTTIMEDVTYAHDDAGPPSGSMFCGGAGGRDVYFTLHNNFPQVWYFDTFGSSYDTVIRVYNTACMTGAPATQVCRNNQCGTMQSQMARELDAGDWCIVIDEAVPGTGPASLVLNIEKGGHPGNQLAPGTNTVSDNTCNGGNFRKGSCGGVNGPEIGYFATSCPGMTTTLDASTCAAATTSDTILYVTTVTSELACNDNDAACSATVTGASTLSGVGLTDAHLFWLVVDSAGATAPACGPFSLTTTLQ